MLTTEIINKYHLFFLYDVKAHLETLQKLKTVKAEIFIPSHGTPTPSINKLIAINENKIREIISTVLSYCEKPATFDEILSRICNKYKINLNANQYVLISNTIKSYLSFLGEEGKLGMSFFEGSVFWKKKNLEVV